MVGKFAAWVLGLFFFFFCALGTQAPLVGGILFFGCILHLALSSVHLTSTKKRSYTISEEPPLV